MAEEVVLAYPPYQGVEVVEVVEIHQYLKEEQNLEEEEEIGPVEYYCYIHGCNYYNFHH